jgi:hypothetical protein
LRTSVRNPPLNAIILLVYNSYAPQVCSWRRGVSFSCAPPRKKRKMSAGGWHNL